MGWPFRLKISVSAVMVTSFVVALLVTTQGAQSADTPLTFSILALEATVMEWTPVTSSKPVLPLNTPPVMVPSFVDRPAAKVPPEIVPVALFSTLHMFLKVPFLMVLLFITLHMFLKVPFSMVALAPSFVTLHTSLKVPFLMVPLFVTLHVSWKMPSEIVPPSLFVTFPLKVPFSMVALAPSFVTLPVFLKVPLLIMPPFVTLHLFWKVLSLMV